MTDDANTPDDWPDEPDDWAEADRAYHAKWEDESDAADPEDESPGEPDMPGPDYVPVRASVKTVSDGYAGGMAEAGPYIGLGVQIAASMAVFAGGGYALDRWLGTSPWGILAGATLGMIGIMALIVRISREADRETAARRARKPRP